MGKSRLDREIRAEDVEGGTRGRPLPADRSHLFGFDNRCDFTTLPGISIVIRV
jgi:hypothetical protein